MQDTAWPGRGCGKQAGKHTLYNREKADLCRRLLCQGDDKPFQAQRQVDLQGLKTAGRERQRAFKRKRIFI